jgi:hypothetical protein
LSGETGITIPLNPGGKASSGFVIASGRETTLAFGMKFGRIQQKYIRI